MYYLNHDYDLLTNDFANKDINLLEHFMVRYLIKNLPNSWKDYKNNMKHKRKQMSLKNVKIHLRSEKLNRIRTRMRKSKNCPLRLMW